MNATYTVIGQACVAASEPTGRPSVAHLAPVVWPPRGTDPTSVVVAGMRGLSWVCHGGLMRGLDGSGQWLGEGPDPDLEGVPHGTFGIVRGDVSGAAHVVGRLQL